MWVVTPTEHADAAQRTKKRRGHKQRHAETENKEIQIGVKSNNQPPKYAGEAEPADLPRFEVQKKHGPVLNGSV